MSDTVFTDTYDSQWIDTQDAGWGGEPASGDKTITVKHQRLFKVTGTTDTKTAIFNGYGIIKHIIWNKTSASGHKARLLSGNDVIWDGAFNLYGSGGNTRVPDLNINVPFNGLYLDDLDSGELLIYCEHLRRNE